MDQDPSDIRRREQERLMVLEGIELWKQKKQRDSEKRIQDQSELRDMMTKYDPWGRPGHGAPMPGYMRKRKLPHGMQYTLPESTAMETVPPQRHHPLIRFQYHPDGRKSIENVIRYRRSPEEQALYKKQLDEMVLIKKRDREEAERQADELEQKQGFINGFKEEEEELRHDESQKKIGSATSSTMSTTYGVELTPILLQRRIAPRRPLASTDVTRYYVHEPRSTQISETPQEYSQHLMQQVQKKKQKLEELRNRDLESSNQHFETWAHFWGRPGHGAPQGQHRKGHLETLLYRKPIVH